MIFMLIKRYQMDRNTDHELADEHSIIGTMGAQRGPESKKVSNASAQVVPLIILSIDHR